MRGLLAVAICAAWLATGPALAQSPAAPAAEAQAQPQPNPESIQIGLSTDRIAITADFSGADLTIFGSLDNADPQVVRQGRYDVIVVLEGPPRPIIVRRKERVLGVWLNTQSQVFTNVPTSYSVATTRVPQDITSPDSYRQLALGSSNIYMQPLNPDGDPATIAEFTAALRDLKRSTGLYSLRAGGVQFLSQSLFRASLDLAPNVPVGTHRARAFLFRNGVFIKESSAPLGIYKAGFEQSIYDFSRNYGTLYGIFAVALAVLTGWAGRLLFRKD